MGVLIQVIITGISVGAVYGLFAMCISLVYRLTGIVHLALGELAGIGVFATLWIAYGRDSVAGASPRVPVPVAAVAALLLTAALGALVYRAAVDPFVSRGFSVAWVGGVVAAAIALRGLVGVAFPRGSYTAAELLPLGSIGTDGVISLEGGASIQARAVVAGLVAIAFAAAAGRLLGRSRYGGALRAVSDDPVAAALCGVPVRRLRTTAFAAAAFLSAAIAAVTLSGQAVTVGSSSALGLKGLVAAVVARFGSPLRVFGAGVVLGLTETALAAADLGAFELGPAYAEVVPIGIAILLLAAWGDRAPLQERA